MYLDFTQPPSKRLYRHVQAGFIANDTTLSAWGRNHGVVQQTIRQCLCGAMDSPKYQQIRQMIIADVQALANDTGGRVS